MTVYSIKIALRGISPMNWRRLRLPGSTSIADFHHIIQIAMGWDNDYLHCFHIFGKDYGIAYEGGLSSSYNPHKVTMDKLEYCYCILEDDNRHLIPNYGEKAVDAVVTARCTPSTSDSNSGTE